MNGKDLLAVLAMIGPGILLGFVVVLSLLPDGATRTFPAGGDLREQAGAGKSVVVRESPAVAAPQNPTQKRMRDPWEKPPYSKSASTL